MARYVIQTSSDCETECPGGPTLDLTGPDGTFNQTADCVSLVIGPFNPYIRSDQPCVPNPAAQVQNQSGALYPSDPISGIATVPDYGPHPTNSVSLLGPTPLDLVADGSTYEVTWAGQVSADGTQLLASDGTTVLYQADPIPDIIINGNTPTATSVSGIYSTPSPGGRTPMVTLALDDTVPPPDFSIGLDGEVEGHVGTTAERPAHVAGRYFYDTTLGEPIWSNGTVWRRFDINSVTWVTA